MPKGGSPIFRLRVDAFVQPVTDCHRLNAETNVKLGEEPACDRVVLLGTHDASPLTDSRAALAAHKSPARRGEPLSRYFFLIFVEPMFS